VWPDIAGRPDRDIAELSDDSQVTLSLLCHGARAISFPLADFSIVAPNVGGFIVSIADQGALEFVVVFEKAG